MSTHPAFDEGRVAVITGSAPTNQAALPASQLLAASA